MSPPKVRVENSKTINREDPLYLEIFLYLFQVQLVTYHYLNVGCLFRANAPDDSGPVRTVVDLTNVLGIVQELLQVSVAKVSIWDVITDKIAIFT